MLVKLLASRAGPDINQNRGDEVEIADEAEVYRVIEAGQADPLDQKAYEAIKLRVEADLAKAASDETQPSGL